ncbi:MAG: hypothetical protein E6Q98_18220 [Rhodospirillaceae bacterium]|nr:MAG: hypothetical protein E6Q98_18220 [Rhodospirillaceae bacterium]
MAEATEEQITTEAEDYLQIYGDCVRKVEDLCRAETKETLVLAMAHNIAWKAVNALIRSETSADETIAAEMGHIRKCRRSALANSRHRRFESTMERIKAGTYKPPRRRKRRKAKRKVAS